MNRMMTLSFFSTLAIGRIPAYLIAKPQKTDRYREDTPLAILECES
jgi:hypothetical protein